MSMLNYTGIVENVALCTMLGKSIGKLDQIARPASFRTNASQSATQENHQENKQPSEILFFEFQAIF